MRGPRQYSTEERFSFYQSLVRTPLIYSEKDLALLVQNARLDPRLAEVVTEHLRDYWWKYDPYLLNRRLRNQPWPEAVKPLTNQILEFCDGGKSVRQEFVRWVRVVNLGIGNAVPQLYFTPTLVPRGKAQDREFSEALSSFTKVGYFASEILFNKGHAKTLQGRPQASNSTSSLSSTLDSEQILKLNFLSKIRILLADQTLETLVQRYGIDRNTLSKLKSGKIKTMSLGRMARLFDRISNPNLSP